MTFRGKTGDLARSRHPKDVSSCAQSQDPPSHVTKSAYVYILASDRHGTLYTGVTSDLARRLHQHREHVLEGFTSRYEVTRLVWFAQGDDIAAAIALEKKIKNRSRRWKLDLIERQNPAWDDLAADWISPEPEKGVIPRAVAESTAKRRALAEASQNRRETAQQELSDLNAPAFRLADPLADRASLLDINIEYVGWVFAQIEAMSGMTARDILGAEVVDYVPTVIDKVCGDPPPRGSFYLVEHAGRVVAMGGVRRSADGVAELKRVYVRPTGRGQRLGEALTRRLVTDARTFGYRTLRLDTLPFMGAAQALYEAMGFVDCPPYPVEMPEAFRAHIRYMALAL